MESNTNTWHISIDKERDIWTKELINKFINVPNHCHKWKKGNISLINKKNVIKPIIGKCTNYKCYTQIYLWPGTIFASHKKTPASVLNKLLEIYTNNNVDKRMIYNFKSNMREIIANYLRSYYCLDPLTQKNAYNHIACDESLFSHINKRQIWVVV